MENARKKPRNWNPELDVPVYVDSRLAIRVNVSSKAFPNTFTIVDPEDYDLYMLTGKWTVTRGSEGTLYVRKNFEGRSVRLHRLITSAEDGLHVDHINHDTLDNRRSNLRVCLPRLNASNSRSSTGASKYKGVSRCASRMNPWKAQICVRRKSIHLGSFADEREAAKAYNLAAIKYFGEYALLNHV